MNNEEFNIKKENSITPKTRKSKGPIFIIILMFLIILGLVGYILYDKGIIFKSNTETKEEVKDNTSNKPEEKKDNEVSKQDQKKELSNETKKQLLNIIGLTENGYPRATVEDYSNREIVDMGGYDLTGIFVNLSGEVIIKNKDYSFLQQLIKYYASNNGMIKEYLITDEKELSKINALSGASFRNGISKENYKKIAKLYNLPENGDEIFKKVDNEIGIYKDYYVLYPDSFISEFYDVKDSLSYDINENDIIINYNVKLDEVNEAIKNLGKKESELGHINKSIKYTFKQYDDGSYYLYSVYVKNN